MADCIEKRIEVKAPVSRVWRALTDYREFGEWFRVKLEGPFVEGEMSRGRITWPGYEHVKWEALIEKIEPEKLFSFTWGHIKALDKQNYSDDYSNAPTTLVEFRLEPTSNGTLLTLTESGFDKLPADTREEFFRRNDGGWSQQMENIEKHVSKSS
jgi:uncharacterized protein YndB with AHSA1/START domain